jgi:hypothetical protein
MKKLLALLLLSPLAFTETKDLHCVSLEDLPEGKLRNKLISLDVTNEVVWILEVLLDPNSDGEPNWVKLREMNKKISKKGDTSYRWEGFVRVTPDQWRHEYADIWWIDRQSLELEVNKFGDIFSTGTYPATFNRWHELEKYQCEIINNKNEKLNYYKNEEMKWKIYSEKIREETLRKNKI